MMMTIGQFSERTGLRPKTLRYYEEVKLLLPEVRSENGYRHYSDAQIEKAQLISSLRQAGVSVADIRQFLSSDQAQKEDLLARWRDEAATKLLSIQVAHQFLNGLDAQTKHVHLVYWDHPRSIVWFPLEVGTGVQAWNRSAQDYQRRLSAIGLEVERSSYVRFPDDAQSTRCEIGFVIVSQNIPPDQQVEKYAPTLFATLHCQAKMPLPCKPIFATVQQFGFRPVGEPLRKYSDFSDGRYLLMVPVAQY